MEIGKNGCCGKKTGVKQQMRVVVDDLENILGELKIMVGDIKVLMNQIDVVTTKIDNRLDAPDKRRMSTSFLDNARNGGRDTVRPSKSHNQELSRYMHVQANNNNNYEQTEIAHCPNVYSPRVCATRNLPTLKSLPLRNSENKGIKKLRSTGSTSKTSSEEYSYDSAMNPLHAQCSPCSPSPDIQYCGVYERQLDSLLEDQDSDFVEEDLNHHRSSLEAYQQDNCFSYGHDIHSWTAYTLHMIPKRPFTWSADDCLIDSGSDSDFFGEESAQKNRPLGIDSF